MSADITHISICICTFKRGHLLKKLLKELEGQRTDGLFRYSVVIVDNDRSRSGQEVVQSFQKTAGFKVEYFVEPEQNIALARNRAVENAKGELIAFIDDDEFPDQNWLLQLMKAHNHFQADGILGPVLPCFETEPPKWITSGRFFERPAHGTGTVLDWNNTRTGNVLLRRDIFDKGNNMFRREFGSGGEDKDFFRRMISQGMQFVWCNEARVFEVVPPQRQKRCFMLRRALLRGKTPYNQSSNAYLRSIIAIPLYLLVLPFTFFLQHHIFMKYLVKLFDHVGRILSMLGINVIKEKYIVE